MDINKEMNDLITNISALVGVFASKIIKNNTNQNQLFQKNHNEKIEIEKQNQEKDNQINELNEKIRLLEKEKYKNDNIDV